MANILAVGNSAATSSTVTLADGASANLVLMATTGPVPAGAEAIIYSDTSGTDTEIDRLSNAKQSRSVSGPGTFSVYRIPGPTFGVDSL